MLTAVVGASVSGTLAFYGCTLGAELDVQTSGMVAGGVAVVVGLALAVGGGKQEEAITDEQKEWEAELQEGGKVELKEDAFTADEAEKIRTAPEAGCCGPAKPPQNKELKIPHPLGGAELKRMPNGIVDF